MNSITPDYAELLGYFPFDGMRDGQRQALCEIREALLDDEIEFIILDAPTGSGKSGIGVCAAKAAGSAYTLTATKNLQHQYIGDFADLVEMRGRDNYLCDFPRGFFDVSCKTELKCPDDQEAGSPFCRKFYNIYKKAVFADNTLLNFHAALVYLNIEFKNCHKFETRNLLILDEAHGIIDAITDYSTFELRKVWFEANFKEFGTFPEFDSIAQYTDTLQKLKRFLEQIKERGQYRSFKDELRDFIEQGPESIAKVLQDPKNYVVSREHRFEHVNISFKPLEIKEYAHANLFRHGRKTLLMSATFLDLNTFCEMLDLPASKTRIIRMPCTFPVENRPFIVSAAVGYINQNNLQSMLPSMVQRIDEILNRYPDSKGIIHSVTYQNANYIDANLPAKNKARLLYARSAKDQREMLKRHEDNQGPTILLSPSMTEGVNLKGDLSTLQILVKTPWPYYGNVLLQERIKKYPNYYVMLTALTILQAYGRSIRSDTDKADNYCLDAGTHHFIYNNQSIFPPWFLKAVTTVIPR